MKDHQFLEFQTEVPLQSEAAHDAKIQVLQKLKEFDPIKNNLSNDVRAVADKYDLPYGELWAWALDQIFVPANHKKPQVKIIDENAGPEELDQALRTGSYAVRTKAVMNPLVSQATMEHVALHDTNNKVRRAAVIRVKSQDVLKEVAATATDQDLRNRAIRKIEDVDYLHAMLKNKDSDYIRRSVLTAITALGDRKTALEHLAARE